MRHRGSEKSEVFDYFLNHHLVTLFDRESTKFPKLREWDFLRVIFQHCVLTLILFSEYETTKEQ